MKKNKNSEDGAVKPYYRKINFYNCLKYISKL